MLGRIGKETGELILYWIVSSGYRNFKIMRLRKPENIDVLKKSLSSIFEKETLCNTIVVKKNESNTFIS